MLHTFSAYYEDLLHERRGEGGTTGECGFIVQGLGTALEEGRWTQVSALSLGKVEQRLIKGTRASESMLELLPGIGDDNRTVGSRWLWG